MRGPQRIVLLLFILLIGGGSAFIVLSSVRGQQPGPPVALCPGPDEYGYVCRDEPAVEYIDATNDTQLYEDDGLVLIELPFPFTFYGVEYDELWASSNGNLQFSTANTDYENVCLVPQPAADMGDMIAPFWDDLSLTFLGFLQTELVGQAPERMFVIEWDDVLVFGTEDDQVTFEVQLFEGSNDIVFLYEDAQAVNGANGSQATIGIQSVEQGYALQAGCNQNAVHDGSVIHFVHPATGAADARQTSVDLGTNPGHFSVTRQKGLGARLVETLNSRGRQGLSGLQLALLNQRPRLDSEWAWVDLDGDGEQELVGLSRGNIWRPQLVELAVVERDGAGRWHLRWQEWPLARQDRLRSLALSASGDVTGDGREELILRDPVSHSALVLMHGPDGLTLVELPGRCRGSLVLRDENADGVQEIFLGGCAGGRRWSIHWDGQEFTVPGAR